MMVAVMLTLFGHATAQKVERVEPLNWWVGMETPLQLMFYGEALGGSTVSSLNEGIVVKEVHQAESPNYLFVDIEVAADAKSGIYTFEIRKGKKSIKHKYELKERRKGSATRESFNSSDAIYLLMPDRFANGDPSNDTVEGTREALNREERGGRHGGDIQGVIDHLDYISSLGATAIWSTPMTLDDDIEGSYHGYATADYYNIDPRFGTNELYRTMVSEAHNKGLKVIIDMIPNHCGSGHWWLNDLPFSDWINHNKDPVMTNHAMGGLPDPNASEKEVDLCQTGWFVPTMPDNNLRNPFALNYFIQNAVWWVEYADLDGIRVDTFPYGDQEATAEWVKSIIDEYPNLRIVAECWIGLPAHVAYWDGASKNHDGYSSHLPSVMDFPLQEAIVSAVESDKVAWDEGLIKVYNVLTQDFLYNDPRTLMIFASNHDTDRLAHNFKSQPKKMNLATTLVATLRGIPQIYVGDELMFLGEQEYHHIGQRIDFPGGWSGDERNLFDESEHNAKESEVFQHTKKVFNWRKGATAIHEGKTTHFKPNNDLYVYFRYTDNECVMVAVNASQNDATIDWDYYAERTGGYSSGYDIISEQNIELGKELIIPKQSSAIIELKP